MSEFISKLWTKKLRVGRASTFFAFHSPLHLTCRRASQRNPKLVGVLHVNATRILARSFPLILGQKLRGGLLVDQYKAFLVPRKHIHIAAVHVEPERMEMDLITRKKLVKKAVRCDVDQLLKGVDLRELILNAEPVLRVDLSGESGNKF